MNNSIQTEKMAQKRMGMCFGGFFCWYFFGLFLGGRCDWQERNENFFSIVQPFWRAQMCQEEKALCEP